MSNLEFGTRVKVLDKPFVPVIFIGKEGYVTRAKTFYDYTLVCVSIEEHLVVLDSRDLEVIDGRS